MEATGTSFTLDKNGCTSSVEASLKAQDFDLVNAMAAVAQSTHTYWVGWGRADNISYNRPGSGFSHKKNAFMISRNDPHFTYGVVPLQPGKCDPSPNKERYTLPMIIIHELGHMYNFETNQPPNTHGFSMEFERAYQIRNNMTPRPDACHF
jgi:hypothetical protein